MKLFQSWTQEAEEHIFDWQGLRIRYAALGQGPPLVLLHGLGLSCQEWEHNIAALLPHGRIYALDLPGCGGSDKPAAPLSSEELARAVCDWARALKLKQITWVGHSFGAEVALWAALRLPRCTRSLILAAMPPLGARELPQLMLRLLHDGPREWLQLQEQPQACLDFVWRFSQAYLQAGVSQMVESFEKSGCSRLPELLGRIQAPALVIHGSQDPVVGVSDSRRLAAALPQGRLCLLEGPHALNYTAAEAFNRSVSAFLAELEAPVPVCAA